MKYGEQFEKESVPQWSLYNIDYNSLKHHIKVHTTKDQATAIAIPGRQDTALGKFENDLYAELCRQHDRVDLFVTSKADEIARRLQHLSSQIHRLILRCATSRRERIPLKRQQRFAKYEQQLLQCGDEIRSLQRFVNAQVVAFRKILKKYRKWTGSSTLGSRFRDNILSHSKSFTRRDFAPLQSQYNDLFETLHAALPSDLDTASPRCESRDSRPPSAQLSPSETIVAPEPQPAQVGYWNEYDYGSEAGDLDRNGETEYAIYIDPNEDYGFPGMKILGAFFTKPVSKLNAWITFRRNHGGAIHDDEHGPLLPTHTTVHPYGSTSRSPPSPSYFSTPPGTGGGGTLSSLPTLDTDVEDDYPNNRHNSRPGSHGGGGTAAGYASSSDGDHHSSPSSLLFPPGYRAHYSAACLPSVADQRVARYRERVLAAATAACLAVAWVLMGVVGALVVAESRRRNRGRVRLEVDAGVILGIVTSLGLACAALCMACSRRDRVSVGAWLGVGVGFVGACGVNGALLVVVMGHARM